MYRQLSAHRVDCSHGAILGTMICHWHSISFENFHLGWDSHFWISNLFYLHASFKTFSLTSIFLYLSIHLKCMLMCVYTHSTYMHNKYPILKCTIMLYDFFLFFSLKVSWGDFQISTCRKSYLIKKWLLGIL